MNNPLKYTDPSGHFLDFLWDLGSLIWDIGQCIFNPGDASNWAALGADALCLILPGVTGGGALVRSADKISDVTKAFNKGTDFANFGTDAARLANAGTDAANLANRGGDALRGGDAATTAMRAADNAGSSTRTIPNPFGRRGSPAHQAAIGKQEAIWRDQDWKTFSGGSEKERLFGNRYPDLVMEKDGKKIAIQVGKTTKTGQPIARERRALDDLQVSESFSNVYFVGY